MHQGFAPKLGRPARLAGLATLVLVTLLFVWEAPARGQAETAAKLAKGTADFLKQRFESEAERLFLDGLARGVCEKPEDNGEEKKIENPYFPKFCGFYKQFGQDAVYSSYASLVAALRQDVHEIPVNLLEQLEKVNRVQGWTMGFKILEKLNEKLRSGQKPAVLIAGFADDKTNQDECEWAADDPTKRNSPFCGLILFGLFGELYQTFQVLAADAERDKDKGIDSEEMLVEFCRVVVQPKYDPVKTLLETGFSDCKLIADGKNQELVRRILEGVPRLSTESLQVVVKWKRTDSSGRAAAKILLAEFGIDINDIKFNLDIAKNLLKVSEARDKFVAYKLKIRRLIGEAKRVEDLLDKTSGSIRTVVAIIEYSALSISVLNSFDAISGNAKATEGYKHFRRNLDMANELVILISEKKFQEALLKFSEQLAEHSSSSNKEVERLKRYLPIMFDLAAAESAEDVTKVLDRAAAPVGAWRLKLDSNYIGINAFVGYAAGGERLVRVAEPRFAFYHGVFAPIGFDWTRPTGAKTGSHGLFLSLFDLGNLLSFRQGRDPETGTVEDQPGEDPKNLVSIGVYYHFTLAKRTGLVGGFGAAYSPAGREFNEQGSGGPDDVPVVRVTLFFIAFDIPIFPIRTDRR